MNGGTSSSITTNSTGSIVGISSITTQFDVGTDFTVNSAGGDIILGSDAANSIRVDGNGSGADDITIAGGSIVNTVTGTYEIDGMATSQNDYILYYDNGTGALTYGTTNTMRQKNVTTTTYTIVQADNNYVIHFTNAAGCTVTLDDAVTNNHAFVAIRNNGAGVVTFQSDGTSVLRAPDNVLTMDTEHGWATWVKDGATTFYGSTGGGGGGGGGGGTYTAGSGMTLTGSAFDLGGALTGTATLTGNATEIINFGTSGADRLAQFNVNATTVGLNQNSGANFSIGSTGANQSMSASGNGTTINHSGDIAGAVLLTHKSYTNTTNSAPIVRHTGISSGTVANGFGNNIQHYLELDNGTVNEAMVDYWWWSDAANASRNSDWKKALYIDGSATDVYAINTSSGTPVHTITGNLTVTGTFTTPQSLVSASTSTAGATITLDFANSGVNSVQKIFTGSATFAANKTVAFSNAGSALSFAFHFEVTNVAGTLTWPANVIMADVNWNTTTQIWTPPTVGKYVASATFDGTDWRVNISGAYN